MHDALLTGLFRALVGRIGGVDAAAALLEARWGVGSKSHLSRMAAGSLGVTIEAVMALEDALGEAPVTQYLALRLGDGSLPMTSKSIVAMVAHAAVAGGQAQLALARALDDRGPGGARITDAELGEIGAAAVQMRRVADEFLDAVAHHDARMPDAKGGA